MKIQDLIIDYRKKHGLSQRQFAKRCEMSNAYIAMLEKGVNPSTNLPITPTLPALRKIAAAMGMTLDDLFALDDDFMINLSYSGRERTEESQSSDEAKLIEIYRGLSDEKQKQLIDYGRFLRQQEGAE